jgi:uroporphyrin-III C-methyltransferase/precorrin-2 dehydrogenase/sirohydrochlorin ferrochelatase
MRLPVFLEIEGRRVLVVGGGAVATRRGRALLAAGADVTVVAPDVSPELDSAGVTVVRRGFDPGDVAGAWLVLACTDDATVNRLVATVARDGGTWCIRADDAAASDAWLPAATRVDDVTVAVSAGGDPGRAGTIRDAVERRLRDGELTSRRTRTSPAGRVVLVGGGPGDPDLLTLKGFRALLDADVVVTDRLGPTGLLDLLPSWVEVIDVGKNPRGPAAHQADINTLLVERAEAGQVVVRLKGGDPFVLGRGTEEVDACVAAGVDVQVVPGVTSAVAAATLAGVPLTERGTTQQFTVVSGHVPPGDPRSTVDWDRLAAGDGTLVLLMAVANLAVIAAALVAGGRDPATPVTVVENASLPEQRVRSCRLAELGDVVTRFAITPPAVAIIGDVVRLPATATADSTGIA